MNKSGKRFLKGEHALSPQKPPVCAKKIKENETCMWNNISEDRVEGQCVKNTLFVESHELINLEAFFFPQLLLATPSQSFLRCFQPPAVRFTMRR